MVAPHNSDSAQRRTTYAYRDLDSDDLKSIVEGYLNHPYETGSVQDTRNEYKVGQTYSISKIY